MKLFFVGIEPTFVGEKARFSRDVVLSGNAAEDGVEPGPELRLGGDRGDVWPHGACGVLFAVSRLLVMLAAAKWSPDDAKSE